MNKFNVVNPANEEIICSLSYYGKEKTKNLIEKAHLSYQIWKKTNPFERAKILKKASDLIRENLPDLSKITTQESGKPIAQSEGEWKVSADLFEWFGEEAKRFYGVVIPASQNTRRMNVIWQPLGIVGIITAWNFPIWNLARAWGAALAAGNCIIAKPSEFTPLTAIELTKIFEKAGMPNDVINLVYGNAEEIGNELLENEKVKKIHFVGSTRVGKLLMDKASITNTKLSLELGGNAAAIIFPDINVEKVAVSAVTAKFRNAGQVCLSPQRFIVHESIKDDFLKYTTLAISKLKVGDPFDTANHIGSLINKAQVDKVSKLVDFAKNNGAIEINCKNTQTFDKGYFYSPKLFEVKPDSILFEEEIFGPVFAVTTFKDKNNAIDIANNCKYGLGGFVWTHDINTYIEVSEALECGIVGVNEWYPQATEAPFGGWKQSGQGSELGHDGIFEYMEKKLITIGNL